MAPVKCYYHACNNTNATKSMFTFPVNDEARLKLWIKHTGNASLASLMNQELKQRFICQDHFKTEDVLKNVSRSRLVPTAVPLMYKPVTSQCTGLEMSSPKTLKVKTPQKVYERKCIDLPMQIDCSPSTSMIDAPLDAERVLKRRRFSDDKEDQTEVKRLKKLVALLQKKNKAQQAKICRLSLKGGQKKKKMLFLQSLRYPSEAAKTFAMMQLRSSKSRKTWTKKEKELCLSIYYKSPATYIHMRRQGIVMAAPSTIRMWLGQTTNGQHCKHSTLQEKSFDEMSIMNSLEYSKKYDQIEG